MILVPCNIPVTDDILSVLLCLILLSFVFAHDEV
jgi:hypothetical protein